VKPYNPGTDSPRYSRSIPPLDDSLAFKCIVMEFQNTRHSRRWRVRNYAQRGRDGQTKCSGSINPQDSRTQIFKDFWARAINSFRPPRIRTRLPPTLILTNRRSVWLAISCPIGKAGAQPQVEIQFSSLVALSDSFWLCAGAKEQK